MSSKRKCPNCSTKTLELIAEGFGGKRWFIDYECSTCKKVVSYPCESCKPIPLWRTEYSISSTIHSPIGINERNWPNHVS